MFGNFKVSCMCVRFCTCVLTAQVSFFTDAAAVLRECLHHGIASGFGRRLHWINWRSEKRYQNHHASYVFVGCKLPRIMGVSDSPV